MGSTNYREGRILIEDREEAVTASTTARNWSLAGFSPWIHYRHESLFKCIRIGLRQLCECL